MGGKKKKQKYANADANMVPKRNMSLLAQQ